MKPFKVSPAQEVTVRFSNKEVQLPKEIQTKIDSYWQELVESGKSYTRGEVFTVTQKEVTETTVNILVVKQGRILPVAALSWMATKMELHARVCAEVKRGGYLFVFV